MPWSKRGFNLTVTKTDQNRTPQKPLQGLVAPNLPYLASSKYELKYRLDKKSRQGESFKAIFAHFRVNFRRNIILQRTLWWQHVAPHLLISMWK
jgi:hypothetical protein